MKQSEHAAHLTIPRGSHKLVIELGVNTPEEGFKPLFRKEHYLPFKKYELVYGTVQMFRATPLFCVIDGKESPVETTLVDGWSGVKYTLTAGRSTIKGKCYTGVLHPKYKDKKMRVAEERKAIWKVGLFRLQLARMRSGHWSKDKFMSEADFLLNC